MDPKFAEFIGVSDIYIALITGDTASGYTAAVPEYLAPAAEVAASVNVNKKATYYDNKAANNYVTEGTTDVKMVVSNVDAKTMAKCLGKFYDTVSGRLIDTGEANPPDVAIGFRYNMGANGYRYYWYLKGTVSGGEEAAATKTDDVDVKNYEMTYTAIPTTFKFEVDGDSKSVKRVIGDTSDENFDATGWFESVQHPTITP